MLIFVCRSTILFPRPPYDTRTLLHPIRHFIDSFPSPVRSDSIRTALQPPKTRKFIDKKNATRFSLVHRSQNDELRDSADHAGLVLRPRADQNQVEIFCLLQCCQTLHNVSFLAQHERRLLFL